MIKELILKNRSFRRFYQEHKIGEDTLLELVDLARLSPSTKNRQALKFLISCEPQKNTLIFPQLAWASQLLDWVGPGEGEKPSAYVIILGDNEISQEFGVDSGIAAQSIKLGAAEKGLGGCILGSIKKDELRQALNIPDRFEILLAIALGKPQEIVIIETVGADGSTNYWRDNQNVHHVPKRRLDDIILR